MRVVQTKECLMKKFDALLVYLRTKTEEDSRKSGKTTAYN